MCKKDTVKICMDVFVKKFQVSSLENYSTGSTTLKLRVLFLLICKIGLTFYDLATEDLSIQLSTDYGSL